MTSYFPDVNTWLALAWEGHIHHHAALTWFESTGAGDRIFFSRFTQLGLLRLVTNGQVMGDSVILLDGAFRLYAGMLDDPRIELLTEPEGLDELMQSVAGPLARQTATKAIGDLYLISFALSAHATLVTFDKAMVRAVKARRKPVVLLSGV